MNTPRIVFFGNERLATGVSTNTPTLRALIETGYEVCAVVSNYERGKSRNARELEIKSVADEHSIPLLLPNKPTDIIEDLKSYNADVAVLVAYGRIIPESVIDIFPFGIINIHPSLLPLHRGPTPIESVILSGEPITGVSIMKLVKEMDAGPVYGFTQLRLTGKESKQELATSLLGLGSTMLIELLPGILSRDIIAQPQDDSKATYDSLITKDSGLLDFNKPAIQLEREIRAYSDWPKSRTKLANIDVVITTSKVSDYSGEIGKAEIKDKQLHIICSQKSLQILSLKPAGKQEMSAESFISGYGSRL